MLGRIGLSGELGVGDTVAFAAAAQPPTSCCAEVIQSVTVGALCQQDRKPELFVDVVVKHHQRFAVSFVGSPLDVSESAVHG